MFPFTLPFHNSSLFSLSLSLPPLSLPIPLSPSHSLTLLILSLSNLPLPFSNSFSPSSNKNPIILILLQGTLSFFALLAPSSVCIPLMRTSFHLHALHYVAPLPWPLLVPLQIPTILPARWFASSSTTSSALSPSSISSKAYFHNLLIACLTILVFPCQNHYYRDPAFVCSNSHRKIVPCLRSLPFNC